MGEQAIRVGKVIKPNQTYDQSKEEFKKKYEELNELIQNTLEPSTKYKVKRGNK